MNPPPYTRSRAGERKKRADEAAKAEKDKN